jgi:hypothetical protein
VQYLLHTVMHSQIALLVLMIASTLKLRVEAAHTYSFHSTAKSTILKKVRFTLRGKQNISEFALQLFLARSLSIKAILR